MKTVTQPKASSLYAEFGKKEQDFLKQILSPLQISALRHNYRPFNYKFQGHFIYISAPACKQLMEFTKEQLRFFTSQVEKDKHYRKIPRRYREVFEDPSEILSLPTYTRKQLCKLQCYSILKIMVLGRQYFLDRKEFGKKSLQTLDKLFKKHNCGHLFEK